MKTIKKSPYYVAMLLSVLFLVMLESCNKDSDGNLININSAAYKGNDTLSYKQLIAPGIGIDTLFAGNISTWYDVPLNNLTCGLKWFNLWKTGSAADTLVAIKFFSKGSATDSGILKITVPFLNTAPSSTYNISLSGNSAINPADLPDFYAGTWYCVFVTKKYPRGIIRGRINPVKVY